MYWKPKNSCDLPYCPICFIAIVWNQTSSISEVCLYSPVLVTSGPDPGNPRTAPTSESLLKLFKLANPKPAYPALPVPFCENHNKALTHAFPSLLQPSD